MKLFSYASRRNSLPRVILGKVKFGFSLSSLLSVLSALWSVLRVFLFFACRAHTHTESTYRERNRKGNGHFSLRFLTLIRETCNGKCFLNFCPSELKIRGS